MLRMTLGSRQKFAISSHFFRESLAWQLLLVLGVFPELRNSIAKSPSQGTAEPRCWGTSSRAWQLAPRPGDALANLPSPKLGCC